jgi:ribonuclease III
MSETDKMQDLQACLGYSFKDAALLMAALTHKSFANESGEERVQHNERLEFLGDAVIDLVVSHYLFVHFPDLNEGEMSRIRSEVVSERLLAQVADNLELGRHLFLGRGEERSGGRHKASLLANALEALLGAVFNDGGFATAYRLTLDLLAAEINLSHQRKVGIDCKTRLQEYYQARFGRPPVYQMVAAQGPDHDRSYRVEVLFDGQVIGQGEGRSKKAAEQAAACTALENLE